MTFLDQFKEFLEYLAGILSSKADKNSDGTITANKFIGDLEGTADVAIKLGTTTVGSETSIFYLNAGSPTVSTATVGTATQPVHLEKGVITASTTTVGSSSVPVYMNAGVITACGTVETASKVGTSTVGSTSIPVYIKSGTPTVCNVAELFVYRSDLSSIQSVAGCFVTDDIPESEAPTTLSNIDYYVVQFSNAKGNDKTQLFFHGGNMYRRYDDESLGSETWSDWFQVYNGNNMYAASFQATSDKRLKENFELGTDYTVEGLIPWIFNFKGSEEKYLGLIAQEVQDKIPWAVKQAENGYLNIDYNAVVAVLCNEITNLKGEIRLLKEKLK